MKQEFVFIDTLITDLNYIEAEAMEETGKSCTAGLEGGFIKIRNTETGKLIGKAWYGDDTEPINSETDYTTLNILIY